ncbi:MAG: protein phosphatase 2C domain-containing protein [Candidatus Aminicenantes bacterium]|nr:protein phosphatase 2C domain-containing protein [Candidatus Aminicenantes bacterium]
MKHLKIAGLTDVGMVREKNEDSLFARIYDDLAVLVVADGMGGYIGGNFASGIVVQAVRKLFDLNRKRLPPDELIEDCLVLANRRVGELSRDRYEGMMVGSTVSMAVVRPPEVHFTNLGDSRLYHLRGSSVEQKSRDHTMLQKLLEAGALKPEEAAGYAHKNIVYKSVNGEEGLEVDPVRTFDLEKGDALLLCSDGLSNYVRPEEMARALQGTSSIREAARYLVNLANRRGGDDNITVVLLEYGKYDRVRGLKLERIPKAVRAGGKRRRRWVLAPLFALLAAAVVLLVAGLRDETLFPRLSGFFSKSKADESVEKVEPAKIEPEDPDGSFGSIPLRSNPQDLSEEEAKKMFEMRGFFAGEWNLGGQFEEEFIAQEPELGFVVARYTGLMWYASSDQPAGLFDDASKHIQDLNDRAVGRHSDWRLPTLEEAASLLRAERNESGGHVSDRFGNIPSLIWTSDREPGGSEESDEGLRWFVDLRQGLIVSMNETSALAKNPRPYVLPVRTHKKKSETRDDGQSRVLPPS